MILTALAISGGFDSMMCVDCAGREFALQVGADFATLTVTAVPLPAALWLLASVLGLLLRFPKKTATSC